VYPKISYQVYYFFVLHVFLQLLVFDVCRIKVRPKLQSTYVLILVFLCGCDEYLCHCLIICRMLRQLMPLNVNYTPTCVHSLHLLHTFLNLTDSCMGLVGSVNYKKLEDSDIHKFCHLLCFGRTVISCVEYTLDIDILFHL
jgi:hypothetical protein